MPAESCAAMPALGLLRLKSIIETIEPIFWSQYHLGTYARKSFEAFDAL